MNGVKHIVECQCILPIYKDRESPPFHKFVVFSLLDEKDTVVEKYVRCANCGSVHKIIDLCKSEIIPARENSRGIVSKDDLKMILDAGVSNILETYKSDLPCWEEAKHIIDNQMWGSYIVIARDESTDGIVNGKMLIFQGQGKFSIESFSRDDSIEDRTL